MIDIELFLLATLVCMVASILQAAVGYGFGLVAVPLLLMVSPAFIPVPLIMASLLLMAYVAAKNRFALADHKIWPLLLGLCIGAPIGAYLLGVFSSTALGYWVAFVVSIGLVASLSGIVFPINPPNQFLAGLLSNVFGTSTGVGGPPIALLYQNQSAPAIRAVLSTSFFLGGLLSLTALWGTGHVTAQSIQMTAYLLPGIVIGAALGSYAARFLSAVVARYAILVISGLSVVYLVIRH
ncbi:MAG: sulfite exporter TauE/SafE family protein [Pseudomonadota bacterium]